MFLVNVTGNYFSFLVFIFWGIVEVILTIFDKLYLESGYLEYLPMKLSNLIVGEKYMNDMEISVLACYFILLHVGNFLIVKTKVL